jgi:hypothetical protein
MRCSIEAWLFPEICLRWYASSSPARISSRPAGEDLNLHRIGTHAGDQVDVAGLLDAHIDTRVEES